LETPVVFSSASCNNPLRCGMTWPQLSIRLRATPTPMGAFNQQKGTNQNLCDFRIYIDRHPTHDRAVGWGGGGIYTCPPRGTEAWLFADRQFCRGFFPAEAVSFHATTCTAFPAISCNRVLHNWLYSREDFKFHEHHSIAPRSKQQYVSLLIVLRFAALLLYGGEATCNMLAKSQFHLPRPQCTKIPPLPHPTVDWRLVHTPITMYKSITCTKTPSNSKASLSIQSFRHLDIHDKMP
jgi:hypothetical protein